MKHIANIIYIIGICLGFIALLPTVILFGPLFFIAKLGNWVITNQIVGKTADDK